MGHWKAWYNKKTEQQNKSSKNVDVHSMQAMPLCPDQSYIQRLDAVLSHEFFAGKDSLVN